MANYISKITLPSGATYDIKDASAWAAIGALTGISFSVAWNGSSAPTVANIPKGVTVTYQGTAYTGTKEASTANTGTFYLVYSGTQKDETDIYDEYVVVTNGSTKTWEKIGDTGAKFSDIVLKKQTASVIKTVSIDKQPTFSAPGTTTDEVLGSGTTFTVSKPGVTVSNTSTFLGASVSGGSVNIDSSVKAITGFGTHTTKNALGANATFTTTVTPTIKSLSATVSKNVGVTLNKSEVTVPTELVIETEPTITLNSSTKSTTNAVKYIDGGSVSRKDDVSVASTGTAAVVTGYAAPTTGAALGSNATFTTSVTPTTTNIKATASGTAVGANGIETFVKSYPGTTSKLVTTSISGVSGSTKASKVTAATSQTTATGGSTASQTNTDWLRGVSVTGETLTIGAATLDTQTTTQFTAADVTVPKAAAAITVATGSLAATGTGSEVMTGLGTASTASALTGVKVTSQPTISLATGATSGTGVISVATGITSASTTALDKDTITAITGLGTASTATVLTGVKVTTQPTFNFSGTSKYMTATASGTEIGVDAVTGVLGTNTSVTVTQPTITLSAGTGGDVAITTGITSATTTTNAKDTVTAITALGTPETANAVTAISHTNPTVTLTSNTATANGRVKVLTGSSAELSATPTVTVGANDKVNAVITVAAPTRSQDVALNTSTASVLLSTTDVSINS